jgi:hypothetical protein
MTWSWRTTDGYVEVDKTGDGSFEAIALGPPGYQDHATARTEQWIPLAAKYAALEAVPLAWVLATIYSESGGDPTAGSSDDLGAGLMQLTLSIYHLTRAQAEDPETSIRLGTHTLGQLYKKAHGDLPAVASMYNAGETSMGPHPDVADPWGYRETRPSQPFSGYIEKVVAASNYWTDKLPSMPQGTGATAPSQAGMGSGLLMMGAAAVGAFYACKAWLCGGKDKRPR